MLDYSKKKKRYLVVKLFDGQTLHITPPKKKLFSKMAALDSLEENNFSDEKVNELYSLGAEILSSNLEGVKFTVDEVGETFDFEDLILLYKEYSTFTEGSTNDPN